MPGYETITSSDGYQLLTSNDEELLIQTNQFSIGFCVSSSEEDRLDKTAYLSDFTWMTGSLREESSILAPTITVEYAGFPNWNYAYIPNFNRYYFITDIISVRTNLWRVSFRVDPMMSFKGNIKDTPALIARNEFEYDIRVRDEMVPTLYAKKVDEFTASTQRANLWFVPQNSLNRHIAVTTIVPVRGNQNNVDSPSPDPGYLPSVKGANFVGSSACITYAMTDEEFFSLSKSVLEKESRGTFIISAISYPYNLPLVPGESPKVVYLGKDAIIDIRAEPPSALTARTCASPYLTYGVLGDFTLDLTNSFLDYEPYTTVEVYVPYAGWAKIPLEVTSDLSSRHTIVCYYAIDHINGTATAYLYDKTAHRPLWSGSAQLGIMLAINSTNAYENKMAENANMVNLTLNTIGSIFGMAMGMAGASASKNGEGGVSQYFKSGLSLGGGIASYFTTQNNIVDRAQASSSTGVSALSSVEKIKVRVTRTRVPQYDNNDFRHQYGMPLNEVRTIGALRGFTVVGQVHLEIPSAYPAEVAQIEATLKGGFHI